MDSKNMLAINVRIVPFGQVTVNVRQSAVSEERESDRPQNLRYFVPHETASGTYEIVYKRLSDSGSSSTLVT
jgi:hypothetical protein